MFKKINADNQRFNSFLLTFEILFFTPSHFFDVKNVKKVKINFAHDFFSHSAAHESALRMHESELRNYESALRLTEGQTSSALPLKGEEIVYS